MFYVYILKDETGRKYIGCTFDLKNRIAEHNAGETKSTKNRGRQSLVWYGCFPSRKLAYDFESYLKSSSGHAFTRKHLI